MSIELIPNRKVMPTEESSSVRGNPSMYDQLGESFQRLGQAVQNGGATMVEIDHHYKLIEADKQSNDAVDADLIKYGAYKLTQDNNPDDSTYVKNYETFRNTHEKELLAAAKNPIAKTRIKEYLSQQNARRTVETGNAAKSKLNERVEAGNYDGIDAIVEGAYAGQLAPEVIGHIAPHTLGDEIFGTQKDAGGVQVGSVNQAPQKRMTRRDMAMAAVDGRLANQKAAGILDDMKVQHWRQYAKKVADTYEKGLLDARKSEVLNIAGQFATLDEGMQFIGQQQDLAIEDRKRVGESLKFFREQNDKAQADLLVANQDLTNRGFLIRMREGKLPLFEIDSALANTGDKYDPQKPTITAEQYKFFNENIGKKSPIDTPDQLQWDIPEAIRKAKTGEIPIGQAEKLFKDNYAKLSESHRDAWTKDLNAAYEAAAKPNDILKNPAVTNGFTSITSLKSSGGYVGIKTGDMTPVDKQANEKAWRAVRSEFGRWAEANKDKVNQPDWDAMVEEKIGKLTAPFEKKAALSTIYSIFRYHTYDQARLKELRNEQIAEAVSDEDGTTVETKGTKSKELTPETLSPEYKRTWESLKSQGVSWERFVERLKKRSI